MELTEFEKELIEFLREKGIKEMKNPGHLIIHYNNDKKPQKVELMRVDIKEI